MDTTQTKDITPAVGAPLDRVDGRLKVTGGARYSADMPVADAAYAVLIMSTVACGKITSIDASQAEALPGVLRVITPANALPLAGAAEVQAKPAPTKKAVQTHTETGPTALKLSLLQNTDVLYQNQPVGIVVADTFERATYAASLVKYEYDSQEPRTEIDREKKNAFPPLPDPKKPTDSSRGDLKQGLAAASSKISADYVTPVENHNPMEPHATLAVWEGSRLTVYDATQGVFSTRKSLAQIFGVPNDNVRVVSHFLGGGFGCKGSAWSHVPLAAMAAKMTGRPVKLVLSRRQMYGPVGYRSRTEQTIQLGAMKDGTLSAVRHDSLSQTCTFDEFLETPAQATRILYAVPNQETMQRMVRLDVGTPTYMRAPGEAPGTFGIESAMDELAYELGMDPVALRLQNYAEKDPESGKPWSSKSLRECYTVAAEKFHWAERTPAPRSMTTSDGKLRGLGMATATYPMNRQGASAFAQIFKDGTGYSKAGTQDLGTGTYTVMTQTAADALGLPPERVRFELGDTLMPETPVSGGSQTAASTGSAVKAAGLAVRAKAIALAIADSASPLSGLTAEDVGVKDGRMFSLADPAKGETYTALLTRQGLPSLDAKVESKPGEEKDKYAMHSFGAVYVEVHVDPDLGEVRIARVVAAYGVGNILNAKTANSQLKGGIIFGIGMALLEETLTDRRTGRVMNADLAEYHVPVNADVPDIDITFVPETDPYVNPLGVKGIGEIGITGVVAAIANAVYHATGKRVRDLPVTLDKVI